jgi:hypothetical protein
LNKTFQEEALFELHFWLQILGDHSRFIHDSLAPSEVENIKIANAFIKEFDQLLLTSRQQLDEQLLRTLLHNANKASVEIRTFKLQMLSEQLVGNIKISLPQSFINHMVNEVEEAIRLFSSLEKGQIAPAVHPLHHDLLWLLDAAGHAGAIDANLDRVEKPLHAISRKFTKEWEDFYLKAIELAGFLRTNIMKFPALEKFHNDVHLEMTIFQVFLHELEEMGLNKETLGTFTPLMADHMSREESYYLMKLAATAGTPPPKENPTKPRIEA